MDQRREVNEFLTAMRARLTPEQAGVPMFGGERRVPGLRREEVGAPPSGIGRRLGLGIPVPLTSPDEPRPRRLTPSRGWRHTG